jgi:hypothetical protein
MKLFLFSIRFYQKFLSPDQGIFRRRQKICAFFPSCSEYACQALMKYGAIKGGYSSLRRILRCHPWQKNNFDPL